MNWREFLARWTGLAVALCALIALSPLLAAIALAVLMADGRPVLFRQWRVGQNGTLFEILKFRTMHDDPCAASIASANDRRITPLGRRLRRFKLDELPQLGNVLRGEMNLIGPRPEVPEFVDPENLLWKKVLLAKPGITDLASLLYRDEEEILRSVSDPEELYRRKILPLKLRLNITYSARRNWRKDLQVLRLTLCYSLFPGRFDRRKIAGAFGISEVDLAGGTVAAVRPRDGVNAAGVRG